VREATQARLRALRELRGSLPQTPCRLPVGGVTTDSATDW
jgi:hypothetical protein